MYSKMKHCFALKFTPQLKFWAVKRMKLKYKLFLSHLTSFYCVFLQYTLKLQEKFSTVELIKLILSIKLSCLFVDIFRL